MEALGGFDVAAVVAIVAELGLAAAAWRLATALRDRVENHEVRISVVEAVIANAQVVQAPAE